MKLFSQSEPPFVVESSIVFVSKDKLIRHKYRKVRGNNGYTLGQSLQRGSQSARDGKKFVLPTFDDGPKEAVMINKIMDILDNHKAKAIFFVNGYRVKEHPKLLKLTMTVDSRSATITGTTLR